jgi:hypothetical protein
MFCYQIFTKVPLIIIIIINSNTIALLAIILFEKTSKTEMA